MTKKHACAIGAFVICFVGVMTGFERFVIDTLALGTGVAIGFSTGMGIRKLLKR